MEKLFWGEPHIIYCRTGTKRQTFFGKNILIPAPAGVPYFFLTPCKSSGSGGRKTFTDKWLIAASFHWNALSIPVNYLIAAVVDDGAVTLDFWA